MNTTNTKKITTTIVFSTLLFIVLAIATHADIFSRQFVNITLNDTYISNDSDMNVSLGNHVNYYLGTYDGQHTMYQTIVKFETDNFNISFTSIENATLRIKKSSTIGPSGCADSVAVYKISSQWTELDTTWIRRTATQNWATAGLDNITDYNSTIISLTSCNTPEVPNGGWCVIDITAIMAEFLLTNGGNGILLKPYNAIYSSDRYCGFYSSDTVNPLNAPTINITYSGPIITESQAQPVILQAINSIVPSSTKYNYQQVYLVNANGNQTYATWDYYVLNNNQRWAINYVTGNEQFVQSANLTPSVYVLETANLPSTALRIQVETFLNTTLNT